MERVSSCKGIRLRKTKRIQEPYYRLKLDGTLKKAFEGERIRRYRMDQGEETGEMT